MNITRLPGMITDIQLGKRSLDVIAQHQAEVLGAEEGEPLFFLTSAGAVVVHDFYNTIEKTFCQIAEEIDGGLPQGDAWYQRLLQRMTVAIPAYRPAVIDHAGRTPGRISTFSPSFSPYLWFRIGLGAHSPSFG